MTHTHLENIPRRIVDPIWLKNEALLTLRQLYRDVPELPKYFEMTAEKKYDTGFIFPGSQERDFGALLYHRLAHRHPELVKTFLQSETHVMHCEMGYKWAGLTKRNWKVDMAFIHPNPKPKMRWAHQFTSIRNLRILGAIELKRDFYQPVRKFMEDFDALSLLSKHANRRVFGILAVPYLWPTTPRERRSQISKIRCLCDKIGKARDKGHDISLVSMDYLDRCSPFKYPLEPNDEGFTDASKLPTRIANS
jgi:hypothetical protein